MASNSLEELKKHKLALGLIGLLLVVKFIVMPVMEWQDSLYAETILLERKHDRVNALLDNREQVDEYAAELEQNLTEMSRLFLTKTDDSNFQLTQQRWLESKLSELDISLRNIGWSPTREIVELNAFAYPAQLNLDGKTESILKLMQQIHSLPHFVQVQELTLNLSKQREQNLGSMRARVNLTFYAREGSL